MAISDPALRWKMLYEEAERELKQCKKELEWWKSAARTATIVFALLALLVNI